MSESLTFSGPDQEGDLSTRFGADDPTIQSGHLPRFIPLDEGQPLVTHASETSPSQAPQWPAAYTTPIKYLVPPEGGPSEVPEAAHPQPAWQNLMDGKNHGAFVAPVAPVENGSDTTYHYERPSTPTPQPRWTVEELAKKRGLTTTELHAQYPALKRDLHYINEARDRGIHLS